MASTLNDLEAESRAEFRYKPKAAGRSETCLGRHIFPTCDVASEQELITFKCRHFPATLTNEILCRQFILESWNQRH